MKSIISRSLDETHSLGEKIGRYLVGGDLLALVGMLGSGKTSFVQGLARGLGIDGYVRSPSFTLINEYKGRLFLYHFDLYRIDSFEEILELGYREYFYQRDGVCCIEWAERFPQILPEEYLRIEFDFIDLSSREIKLIPFGDHYKEILGIMTKG